jgi:putative transcriptional regulator
MDYEEAERILACVMERLERERHRQGLSQSRLAVISGVSRMAIGMIEKGQRSPSLIICLRVADALDLDLGDVLKNISKRKRGK